MPPRLPRKKSYIGLGAVYLWCIFLAITIEMQALPVAI